MEFIKIDKQTVKAVALIELNRPKELNALNPRLMGELLEALREIDSDESMRAAVITGNEKAFAAGADIREMAERSAVEMVLRDEFRVWDQISQTVKPVIAAVSGYALGGGCELAMMCDIIVASETAQFGQPEVRIGTIPGAGGTQRLTHALGKSKAMELILTGRMLSAREALQHGLVSHVYPVESYLQEAIRLASEIAAMPGVMTRLAKEAVNAAYRLGLEDGLAFERRNFYLSFATADQKEGMKAFLEKRKPDFSGK